MNINLTFFIQIFHFFVSYLFLSKFFFNPTIESLSQKNTYKQKLISSIQKEESDIVALHKEIGEHLLSFQQHIKLRYPFIELQPQTVLDKRLETPLRQMDTAQLEPLKNDITQWIIKKVPYAS